MALAILSVLERSPTRVRLVFDGALAGAAFTPASYQAAESYDGSATAVRLWAVTGALAIATDSKAIELVLSEALTGGAWAWVVFVVPVPAASGGPFAGSVSPTFRAAEALPRPSPEVPTSDLDAVLWGEDLQHDGEDWIESADGDLAVITGPENAKGAAVRRQVSEGVLWDGSYGLRPRRFVDAPAITAAAIRGDAQAQAVADDRVVVAQSRVGTVDPITPDVVVIETDLTFFTGQTATVSSPIS